MVYHHLHKCSVDEKWFHSFRQIQAIIIPITAIPKKKCLQSLDFLENFWLFLNQKALAARFYHHKHICGIKSEHYDKWDDYNWLNELQGEENHLLIIPNIFPIFSFNEIFKYIWMICSKGQ